MNYLNNLDIFFYQNIDSTNNESKRLIERGLKKSSLILARSQTNGRGKNNNNWVSPEGNLYCTFILKNYNLPLAKQVFFCFLTAIAIYDILDNFKILHKYSKYIKWPNDIIVDGKKISGILIESLKHQNDSYLLIGIGINIINSPKNLQNQTTSLYELGAKKLKIEKLLKELTITIDKYIDLWQIKGEEFLINEWLKRSYPVNSQIKFNYKNQIIMGFFKGIANDGNILIEVNSEIISFGIGEVLKIC